MAREEVLKQYFFVVDPSRINDVPDLIKKHSHSFHDLCRTLLIEYGLDPMKPLTFKEITEWKKQRYGTVID